MILKSDIHNGILHRRKQANVKDNPFLKKKKKNPPQNKNPNKPTNSNKTPKSSQVCCRNYVNGGTTRGSRPRIH